MNIKGFLKALGMDVGVSGIMAATLDALKNGVKKAGEKYSKKLEEDHRSEMLAFIRSLDAVDHQASENLLRRQRERQACLPRSYGAKKPYAPGDENMLVELLTKLYKSLDESDKREARKQTFKWLGRLDDEKFDETLEFLNHDVLTQWFKKLGVWLSKAGSGLPSSKPLEIYQKLDQKAKEIAEKIQEKNEKFEAKRKGFKLYR